MATKPYRDFSPRIHRRFQGMYLSDLITVTNVAWINDLTGAEFRLVWPSASGNIRGLEFDPIHASCVHLAKASSVSAEALKVVDGLRSGAARVRRLAESELSRILTGRVEV